MRKSEASKLVPLSSTDILLLKGKPYAKFCNTINSSSGIKEEKWDYLVESENTIESYIFRNEQLVRCGKVPCVHNINNSTKKKKIK